MATTINCDKLGANITACGVNPQRGFDETAYLLDISTATITQSGNLWIDLSGCTLYSVKVNGLQPFNGTNIKSAQQLAAVLFESQVSFPIVGVNPTNAATVNKLTNGRYAMIFKQKGANDNSKYLVVGGETGLKFESSEMTAYDDSNGFKIMLKESGAINSAQFLYKTNVATTDDLIASLLSA